jgi:hypothetical protein
MPGPKTKDEDENSGREFERHVDRMYRGQTDEEEDEKKDEDSE